MAIKLRTLGGIKNIEDKDYLEASLEVYDWLENQKLKGENGVYYRTNPGALIDYESHPVHGKYGLYSGSAGIGFFLLRLYETTKDEKYLQEVKEIVSELIENVAGPEFYENKLQTAMNSELKITGWHTGIYAGPSGAGLLAIELFKYVKDKNYLEFAKRLADDILKVSITRSEGLTLTEDLDVFSDGGFVLYFISVYKATNEKKYLDAAREYAAFIYSKRQSFEKGGEFYFANELKNVGMPEDSIYPGFAHGTAGIGYIFAVLYEIDKQAWQLEGAKEIGKFLEKIADQVGEGLLVPYLYGGIDSEYYKGKYYLGFCHGPAGTALFYRKLYDITKAVEYKNIVEKLAKGVLEAGAPEYNSWGLWDSNCLCCGVPGLIEFFVEMYEFTKDEKYISYAKRAAAKTIANSREVPEGRTFFGNWDRTDNRNIQTYTGLYTGAAGSAANLLRLYALLSEKSVTPIFEYIYL